MHKINVFCFITMYFSFITMHFSFMAYKHQRELNINDANNDIGRMQSNYQANIIDLDFKLFDIGFNIKRANLIRSV